MLLHTHSSLPVTYAGTSTLALDSPTVHQVNIYLQTINIAVISVCAVIFFIWIRRKYMKQQVIPVSQSLVSTGASTRGTSAKNDWFALLQSVGKSDSFSALESGDIVIKQSGCQNIYNELPPPGVTNQHGCHDFRTIANDYKTIANEQTLCELYCSENLPLPPEQNPVYTNLLSKDSPRYQSVLHDHYNTAYYI